MKKLYTITAVVVVTKKIFTFYFPHIILFSKNKQFPDFMIKSNSNSLLLLLPIRRVIRI